MASIITFGGIGLIAPDDEHLAAVAAIEAPFFQTPSWSGLGGRGADFNEARTGKIGCLHWPRGASRFAIAHFLVAQSQLEAIRLLVKPDPDSDTAPIPQTLLISDGTRSISTSMYLLASRPVVQFSWPVWLLTLVDVRYFWWQTAASIPVTAGTTTWADLVEDIADALDETITLDAVESAYLKPHGDLATAYEYLPPLLDAVAYSVGRQVVRKLDGTITLQKPANAKTARDTLLTAYEKYTIRGGSLALGVDADHDGDVFTLVPAKVAMASRQLDITVADPGSCDCSTDQTWSTSVANVVTDSLPGCDAYYREIGQFDGEKIVRSTAVAWFDGVTAQNATELADLVEQWAGDWYLWRLADQHRLFNVIVPWEGDGFADVVEWQGYGSLCTRVCRGPLNEVADRVWHLTESGETPTSPVTEAVTVITSLSFNLGTTMAHVGSRVLTYTNGVLTEISGESAVDVPY